MADLPPVSEIVRRLTRSGEINPSAKAQISLHEEEIADRQTTRKLREEVGNKVLITLWVQIGFLAIMILFQGFKLCGFELNEWVFGVFVNGVLIQTFFLVRVIVQDLYPKGGPR
jgi:hypothetical protein